MNVEHKTTTGSVQWTDQALDVTDVDDPTPPDDDPDWKLVGSTMTEVRNSKSTILWFWRRETPIPDRFDTAFNRTA